MYKKPGIIILYMYQKVLLEFSRFLSKSKENAAIAIFFFKSAISSALYPAYHLYL